MMRLRSGDLSGIETPVSAFRKLRNEPDLKVNPRTLESYRLGCVDICGLGSGEHWDAGKYGHLTGPDVDLLRFVVKRGASSMWLPGTTRTAARGFKHRLITRGPPVRVPLHRLSREATEWLETAIAEDVARGQLVKGVSAWGSPAFPTKPTAAHKANQRPTRMVVDYRALIGLPFGRCF